MEKEEEVVTEEGEVDGEAAAEPELSDAEIEKMQKEEETRKWRVHLL